MDVKKGQCFEVDIETVAFGGKGIARIDGLVVFIENTIPKDRVRARIIKKKKNHAIGCIEEIISPSPFRVPAPCQYSGYCGGCKWQSLAYEKQLEVKQQHVVDALEHIGLLNPISVYPTLASDPIYGYRNKMEFSCSDKRWVLPHEMDDATCKRDFALGLHVPGTFNKVMDIEKCWIQPEFGNVILNHIRAYIQTSGLPVYSIRNHVGFWRFIMLRHASSHDQWMVNIVTSEENVPVLQPLADQLRSSYPQIVSVINNITTKKAAIAVGEREVVLSGQPVLKENLGRFTFEISSNSFFQTHTRGAEQLYTVVKQYADLSGNEIVVDLYSGTGTIAIFLSDDAREVIGMEINENSIKDALRNCRMNHISNCRFIQGDIRENLSKFMVKPDVMIMDPPRAGMHPKVVHQILTCAPERMVYVSCNPATLARDLKLMKDAYSVKEIQPVDMFPHTYHVESVARLEKK